MTLIVSVLILVVLVGGVLWLYRGGVRDGGGPPTVGAPAGPDRTAAPAQSATPDASAGLSIYKDNASGASESPAFVAAPEQPGPRPLVAPPAAPAVPAASNAPATEKPKSADAIGELIDKPAAPPARPVKAPPVTKPAGHTTPIKDASAKGLESRVAAPPAVAGTAEVQIGAFSTRAQADQGWTAAAAAAPGAMAGRGKRVVEVSKDGKTLYRTSITGFSTRESAQALCTRLQTAGRSCFVR